MSGNYSASVRVITASCGGFSGDPARKLRILLVCKGQPELQASARGPMPRSYSDRMMSLRWSALQRGIARSLADTS